MKRIFDNDLSIGDLKDAILDLRHHQEDKKTLYIFVGVIVTLLIATVIGVAWLIKSKRDEEDFEDEWDCDWDDEDFEHEYSNAHDENTDDCCCTDNDVDTSVKVEKI